MLQERCETSIRIIRKICGGIRGTESTISSLKTLPDFYDMLQRNNSSPRSLVNKYLKQPHLQESLCEEAWQALLDTGAGISSRFSLMHGSAMMGCPVPNH
jgi:hypothetical protein